MSFVIQLRYANPHQDAETEFVAGKLTGFTPARLERSLADELNAIALRCAKRRVVSQLSADEILGHEGLGVPGSCGTSG